MPRNNTPLEMLLLPVLGLFGVIFQLYMDHVARTYATKTK